MTTIAWDGTTLAADCCSWSGSARRKVRKVFKVKSPGGHFFLVAFAGNGDYVMQILGWMHGERERPDPLTFNEPKDLSLQCALVIDERRRPWRLSCSLHYTRMYEKIFAFGGGQDFAWGALEAGATAVEAVKIAAKRSDYSGLGVNSVRF